MRRSFYKALYPILLCQLCYTATSNPAAGFRKSKDESQSRRGRGKRKDIENCIFWHTARNFSILYPIRYTHLSQLIWHRLISITSLISFLTIAIFFSYRYNEFVGESSYDLIRNDSFASSRSMWWSNAFIPATLITPCLVFCCSWFFCCRNGDVVVVVVAAVFNGIIYVICEH